MIINVLFQNESNTFDTSMKGSSTGSDVDLNNSDNRIELITSGNGGGVSDYRLLTNKPTLNSIVLEGALTAADLGLGSIYYDTTSNWTVQSDLVAERAALYIYSDRSQLIDQGGNVTYIAGIKVGDGTSFLKDLPFLNDASSTVIFQHIANNTIHITAQERELWNHKVSSYIASAEDCENLVLSKTNYVVNGDIMPG